MKRVKSFIKLTNRNSERLNETELNRVTGGFCACGCWYAECGGSSTSENGLTNEYLSFHSIEPSDDAEWG